LQLYFPKNDNFQQVAKVNEFISIYTLDYMP